MEENTHKSPKELRLNQEASDWIAKQDLGFTPEEQDAFFEWLAQDPKHGEAYSARKSVWNDLNILAEWRPEHSVEPNPDLLAVSRKGPIIKWLAVASTLAAGSAGGAKLPMSPKPPMSSNGDDSVAVAAAPPGHTLATNLRRTAIHPT